MNTRPLELILNDLVSVNALTQKEADRYLTIWPLLIREEKSRLILSLFAFYRNKKRED